MSTVTVWGWRINKDVRVRKYPRRDPKKRDEDMGKLEEYLQGDHGHVISPNY